MSLRQLHTPLPLLFNLNHTTCLQVQSPASSPVATHQVLSQHNSAVKCASALPAQASSTPSASQSNSKVTRVSSPAAQSSVTEPAPTDSTNSGSLARHSTEPQHRTPDSLHDSPDALAAPENAFARETSFHNAAASCGDAAAAGSDAAAASGEQAPIAAAATASKPIPYACGVDASIATAPAVAGKCNSPGSVVAVPRAATPAAAAAAPEANDGSEDGNLRAGELPGDVSHIHLLLYFQCICNVSPVWRCQCCQVVYDVGKCDVTAVQGCKLGVGQ